MITEEEKNRLAGLAAEVVTRWRTDLAYTPPEMEDFRWNLIYKELYYLLEEEHEFAG